MPAKRITTSKSVKIVSVIFFIRDIHLSTETLKLHLSDMKIDLD